MKKKKFKKLLVNTLAEFYQEKNNQKKYDAVSEESNHQFYTDTDEETKKKIRNLILRLLEMRDSINFNSNDRSIGLSSEISISGSPNSNMKSNYKSEYFSIDVVKDLGFTLSFSEKRIVLRDEKLYDDIKPQIKIIFDKINNNNFIDLYGIVMKETGLSRESNLDDLLSEWSEG